MRDYLSQLVNKEKAFNRLNVTREYLQSYILLILQKNNFFNIASFVGGTSLRFISQLPRFSEDLDFSLKIEQKDFDFLALIKALRIELQAAGYRLNISYKDNTNVYVAMIKFSELLYPLGLSSNLNQNLNIKLDIDTNPPKGATNQVSLVNKYLPLTLDHYDLSSIMSGKINAIMTRKFVKGRDYYDIFWILTTHPRIVPNMVMLNNALAQFNISCKINDDNWKAELLKLIEGVDMKKVISDVSSFIEDSILIESFNINGFRLLLTAS